VAADDGIHVMKRSNECPAVKVLTLFRKLVPDLDVETASLRKRLHRLDAAQSRAREQPGHLVLL
jgi:hypothetical protein